MKSAGKNGTKETKNDMKRAKFIINEATSDKEILNYTESVIGCLMMNQIVNHVDVIYTNKAEDALKEAQKMIEGEYDFVTAVGGDGTVHDVVNGVIMGEKHTPVAIIPGGTANDFANFLGLGGSKQSFCRMIKSFETIKMDAGKVNDRYFINSAGAGLGINSAFDTSMRSKAVLGKLAYALQLSLIHIFRKFLIKHDKLVWKVCGIKIIQKMRLWMSYSRPWKENTFSRIVLQM